ncbi:MAG: response regulator [Firmicutes bacterium]|nr:response regulator [Bacillota bacterium]
MRRLIAPKIRLLIVDDSPATRENVDKLCRFDDHIEVIGEAQNGREAIVAVKNLQPDIVLMDINMPEIDGITATELISLEAPETGIIMMSVQGEQEYLRKAMVAGAREYLTKPFSGDEVINTIKRVYELEQKRKLQQSLTVVKPAEGRIVTVFSAKGGVGKTTIATNLAVALATEGFRVVLVDLDLQFGDIALMLDLTPKRTITDLVGEGELTAELVGDYLLEHVSGVRVLPAPLRPEEAELVSPAQVQQILGLLKKDYDFVLVDTAPAFLGPILAALDLSEQILLLTTLELSALKNVKLSLETMLSLQYPPEKIRVIINRYATDIGISLDEYEKHLGVSTAGKIPSDGRTVVEAVNKGVPFILSNPKAPVSAAIRDLAAAIGGKGQEGPPVPRSLIGRLRTRLRRAN